MYAFMKCVYVYVWTYACMYICMYVCNNPEIFRFFPMPGNASLVGQVQHG
jgi:hypothetical protein